MLDEELVKKVDEIDDKLWEVAHQLNDYFDVGLDFDTFEHSEFSINIREVILDELEKYKNYEKEVGIESDNIMNENDLMEWYESPVTINQFLQNAFNYIKINGEYACDDLNKPTEWKSDEEVRMIMSNKELFQEYYDVLEDEAGYHGFDVEEIISQIESQNFIKNKGLQVDERFSNIIEPSIEMQAWAKEMNLEHSSTEEYEDFLSHVFVYEDSLIDINEDYEGNKYEVLASKETDDFEPYLEAESDTLEGLNPYINEIKYGKSLTKNNDKGLEI